MSELVNYLLANQPQFKRSRLPSLYSDFRHLKSVNPDGYEANIAAWQAALADAAREGLIPGPSGRHDLLLLNSGPQLLEALETKEYGQPVALPAVIKVAISKNEFVPLQNFFSGAQSGGFALWHLLRWGVGLLPIVGAINVLAEDKLPVGQLVVMELVRDCAEKILMRVTSEDRVGRIWSIEMFKNTFARCQNDRRDLTDADFEVVLHHLARNMKECAYDGRTVKFRCADESTPTITHEDTTIASLKEIIASHESQIETLTSRIDRLAESAKASIAKKNRVAALSALRSKKLAETALTARSNTLAQLEEVFDSIRQASNQVQLVQVMGASTKVLKSLNKRTGGVERVEDVVEELREEMTKVDEVGQIIGEVGKVNTAAEEDEVEDELEALEREEKEKEKAKEEAKRVAETRRRLAEIDKVREPSRQEEPQNVAVAEKLDEQVNALRGLSLEENSPLEKRRLQELEKSERGKLSAD